jgi:ribose transport system substrate-binding protein
MKAARASIVGAVIVVAMMTMTACSPTAGKPTPTATSKTANIAFFDASTTNTYLAATMKGLKKEAAKTHAKITVFNANFDPNAQISQVQDATATGKYNVYIIATLNNAGLVVPVQQARAKGIQVAAILSTIGNNISSLQSSVPGVITVGADLGADGRYVADLIVKACGSLNPCMIAYMPGSPQQASDVVRTNGVNDELKKHPSIKIVSEQAGGFDATTGLTAAQNILTANPHLNVIAAASSQPIAGALQAIEKAGLTGKIKVVSNGGTVQDVQDIRSGKIYGSVAALPETEAVLALRYAIDALNGRKVPITTDDLQSSPIGPFLTKATLSTASGKRFIGEWSSN